MLNCLRPGTVTGTLIALCVVLCISVTEAGADTCIWSTKEVGKSKNERFVVTAVYDREQRQWRADWQDTQLDNSAQAVLQGIEAHAHLAILVRPDGRYFAVLDIAAGHRDNDRILVYDWQGQLVKSYGLKEMLTEAELAKVKHSVSHIQWCSYDPEHKRWYGLNEDETVIELRTMTGRKVEIPLQRATPKEPDSSDESKE